MGGNAAATGNTSGTATGNSAAVNVNGAIINIGSTGARNNSSSGIGDPSFSIYVPGLGRISAENSHRWQAYAQSEIAWRNWSIDDQKRRAYLSASEEASNASYDAWVAAGMPTYFPD